MDDDNNDDDDQPPAAFAASFIAAASLAKDSRPHQSDLPKEPKTWTEMLRHPFAAEWRKAAREEYSQLAQKGTLQIIDKEDALIKPLPLAWVFKYKVDAQGQLTKYKARMVVRGDLQPPPAFDTYAATLAARSLRILLALIARWDLDCRQLDVENAFVHSPLDELVYIKLPEGLDSSGKVGLLHKALYGLRRSPLLWQQTLTKAFNALGLKAIPEEPCLLINDWLLVFFYVDDICYAYRPQDEGKAIAFRQQLSSQFNIKDLGEISWFLGCKITRSRPDRLLWLNQASYIDKITAKYDLDTLNGRPSTPLSAALLPGQSSPLPEWQINGYQSKVGSVLYAAISTRPDIAFATSYLSRFLRQPTHAALEQINRCIQYLFATKHRSLCFHGNQESPELEVFTDASFADDPVDRHSTSGYLIRLYGGPIAWKSGKQATVTTSSTEAELLALTEATKETMATARLFIGMRFDLQEQLRIWCDNVQTIRLVTEQIPRLRTQLRHVDIHNAWVRQQVLQKVVQIQHLPTAKMPADGLTKPLSRANFAKFVANLNLDNKAGPVQEA